MSYNVVVGKIFERESKKLIRKYPSLKSEIIDIIEKLEINPLLGIALGGNCFKIRVAISSKGTGKSGGARIISNFVVSKDTIYLLSIYDKSDKNSISDKELKILIKTMDIEI